MVITEEEEEEGDERLEMQQHLVCCSIHAIYLLITADVEEQPALFISKKDLTPNWILSYGIPKETTVVKFSNFYFIYFFGKQKYITLIVKSL